MTNKKIIKSLRDNSRKSTTEIAKEHNVPITTVFNQIKALEKNKIITKYTTVIDYPKIGLPIWSKIALKTKKDQRNKLKDFLTKKPEVISIFEINSGFDFLIETAYKDHGQLRNFFESLEDKFEIQEKRSFNILKSIK